MIVFSETQAKERLDAVLEEATATGGVHIRRSDGQEFLVKPVPSEGEAGGRRRYRDLSDIAGRGSPDPAFDQAILDQDQIDPELWK